MNHADFLAQLKSLIEEKHLLKHPFYQMWTEGTLPLEVMQRYAEQYYHLEKNFGRFLSLMHADCGEDFEARQAITQNLYEEEAGSENHRELWLRFGEGIGSSREEMKGSNLLPETQAAIECFEKLSSQGFLTGVAGLTAYEDQIPAVAAEKIKGLVANYGIESEETMAFFRVHGVADLAHSEAWWQILDRYADTEENRVKMLQGVTQGRDALWGFLDGIMREYMPEAHAC